MKLQLPNCCVSRTSNCAAISAGNCTRAAIGLHGSQTFVAQKQAARKKCSKRLRAHTLSLGFESTPMHMIASLPLSMRPTVMNDTLTCLLLRASAPPPQ